MFSYQVPVDKQLMEHTTWGLPTRTTLSFQYLGCDSQYCDDIQEGPGGCKAFKGAIS